MKNDIAVMKKDFENRVKSMQTIIAGKDGERDKMRIDY